MSRPVLATVDYRGKCPYCEFPFTLELFDVTGDLFAEKCPDCRQVFVVEASVRVDWIVHRVADVDPADVFDQLEQKDRASSAAAAAAAAEKPASPVAEKPKPARAANGQKPMCKCGRGRVLAKGLCRKCYDAQRYQPKHPVSTVGRAREVQGTRY